MPNNKIEPVNDRPYCAIVSVPHYVTIYVAFNGAAWTPAAAIKVTLQDIAQMIDVFAAEKLYSIHETSFHGVCEQCRDVSSPTLESFWDVVDGLENLKPRNCPDFPCEGVSKHDPDWECLDWSAECSCDDHSCDDDCPFCSRMNWAPRLVGVEENPGPDMVNFTPHFALHGKYVGPGHTGAPKLGKVQFATKPIDELDNAARNHDWAYSKQPKNRGAADAVLAERAWKAIPKVKGLKAKAKAALVATGMYAMSKIGSHSGEKVQDAPPVEQSRKEAVAASRKRKFAARESTIAGKAVSHMEQLAPQPRLVGIEENPGPKPNQKKPSMPKGKKGKASGGRSGGIVDGLMPTQMQNSFDVKPFYRVTSADGDSRTIDTLLSLGNISPSGLPVIPSTTTAVSGGCMYSATIDKTLFAGQNIGRDFDLYERWKILDAEYHLLPSVASSTPGAYWVLPDPDAEDKYSVGATTNSATILGHKFSRKHTLWAGQCRGKATFNRSLLYTDAELVQLSTGGVAPPTGPGVAAENRFFSAGVLSVFAGENLDTGLSSMGELFLRVKIRFSQYQNSDMSSLILSCKASATSGQLVQRVSNVELDPAAFLIRNLTGFNNLVIEYAYNPAMYFPVSGAASYFRLPVGTYLFSYWELYTATVGASLTPTATQVVTGGVYSGVYWAGADFELPPPTLRPEYSYSAPTVVAGASFSFWWLIIRVTQCTSANRVFMQLLPKVAFASNAPAIAQMHYSVMRLPEFGQNALAQYYPRGNFATQVGVGLTMEEEQVFAQLQKKKLLAASTMQKKLEEKEQDDSFWNEKVSLRFRAIDGPLLCHVHGVPRYEQDHWMKELSKKTLAKLEMGVFPTSKSEFEIDYSVPEKEWNLYAEEQKSEVDVLKAQIEELKKQRSGKVISIDEPDSPELVTVVAPQGEPSENPLARSLHLSVEQVKRLLNGKMQG